MTEKVLHEVRFIETDDGFRVEIKGDKEQLKQMGMMHFGKKGFGPGGFFGRGQGRRGFWGRGHGFGPPPWAWDYEPSEEAEKPTATAES
jgi:hypothetical protein